MANAAIWVNSEQNPYLTLVRGARKLPRYNRW